MRTIDTIVIHHTAGNQAADKQSSLAIINGAHDRFQKLYNALGRGIEYHTVIGADWVEKTRDHRSIGWHAGHYPTNRRSIGVCITGNFEYDTITDYQKKALKEDLQHLKHLYNIPRERILLHRDVRRTECPGDNITHRTIDDLLQDRKINIKELFRDIWRREPARGEELYFIKRVGNGSIDNRLEDIANKMKYWEQVVYPGGVYSIAGDLRWQWEKRKVLLGL